MEGPDSGTANPQKQDVALRYDVNGAGNGNVLGHFGVPRQEWEEHECRTVASRMASAKEMDNDK